MIGYNRLGTNGRLGNQMFQYASLRGIAANNNLEFCIPPEDTITYANYGLFDCFKLKNVNHVGMIGGETKDEPGFDFDEELFNNCPDNINIDGYRQSEKYFKHIEDSIREDYEFKEDIYGVCKEYMDQFNGDITLLHVRRGDNVGRPDWYPIPTVDHYEYLLDKYFPNQPILICSDDLDWVKEQPLFKDDRFHLSETRIYYPNEVLNGVGKMETSLVPYYDLCMMTLCNGGIIANSSLSWWGAWLQKNRTNPVIAQDPWFGEKLSFNNLKDLLPEDWIVEKMLDERIQQ
tara:strand:- start:484 stop:1350 length:867 start_codon:yes stop_codon:yes gene_type:complete